MVATTCILCNSRVNIPLLVECGEDNSTATTHIARVTGSGSDTTPTNPVAEDQQGDTIIYIGNYYLSNHRVGRVYM